MFEKKENAPQLNELLEIITSASESVLPFALKFLDKVVSQCFRGRVKLSVEHIDEEVDLSMSETIGNSNLTDGSDFDKK